MNIKQMVFEDHTGEYVKYSWIVYDADNLDTHPLFSGEGETEEEAIAICSKAYYFACREHGE